MGPMKRIFLISAVLLALLGRTATAEETPVQDIRIGAVLHLTGELSMQSNAFREGIELGMADAVAAGVPLKLILEDGQNNPKASHSAGVKLLQDKISVAILSSYIDVMSSGKYLEQRGIPSVCLWDSSPEIDAAGKMIFAIGPWTPSGGEAPAKFAAGKLKAKSAVILRNSDAWSQAVADAFRKQFELDGGKIFDDATIGPEEADFRAVISKFRGLGPDIIYSPLVFNIVPFYSQLRQLGFSGKIVTSDIIAEEHISKAPQVFEGIYQSGLPDPDSAKYRELAAKYRLRFGRNPSLPWFVAVGYDGVMLIAKAVKTKGSSSQAIAEGLYGIKNYAGASALLSINPEGSSPQTEVMYQIRQGRLQRVE